MTTIRTVTSGDHQLLLNDLGNIVEVGRAAASQMIRKLRRNGQHAYPMRFSPRIYFIGIADSPAKARDLEAYYDAQREEVHRILVEEALLA
jgi:hypothetical protein